MACEVINNIRYVVFDLDDTLYCEIEYCKSGFDAVAKEIAANLNLDRSDIYDRLYRRFIGGGRENLFNGVLDELGVEYDKGFIMSLVEKYRNHIPDIALPQQSRAVLDKLSKKVKLGLLTDGYMPAQKLKVQSLGIEKYFDKIVYTELLGRENWKPATAGFELIMRENNFEPHCYVYVADNPAKDFMAPNKLGWMSVWYKNPACVHRQLPQNELQRAKIEIDKLSDLTDILGYGN